MREKVHPGVNIRLGIYQLNLAATHQAARFRAVGRKVREEVLNVRHRRVRPANCPPRSDATQPYRDELILGNGPIMPLLLARGAAIDRTGPPPGFRPEPEPGLPPGR